MSYERNNGIWCAVSKNKTCDSNGLDMQKWDVGEIATGEEPNGAKVFEMKLLYKQTYL